MELWVARHQKHISCNTIAKHLRTSDAIVTKSQENPTDISLNLDIFNVPKTIEKVHYAFLDQYVDRLL